jgi:hypothetical protein
MMSKTRYYVSLGFAILLVISAGCGKKSEEEKPKTAEATTETPPIEASLSTESVPFGSVIRAAGYEVVYVNEFPSSLAGWKGRLILYNSASKGDDGGIVFAEIGDRQVSWVWHWYFPDTKPKVFERLDVNKDGLWDIRVHTDSGHFDLIQDETYTLAAGGRDDRIALNGTCSAPDADRPLWHCFDGNPVTAWQSSMDAKPYIEVFSPMGLPDGILSIKALDHNQPRECEVYADGKKVQSVDLRPTTDEQLIQLDEKVRTAKKIRLTIKSCHQDCASVAVAELQIK